MDQSNHGFFGGTLNQNSSCGSWDLPNAPLFNVSIFTQRQMLKTQPRVLSSSLPQIPDSSQTLYGNQQLLGCITFYSSRRKEIIWSMNLKTVEKYNLWDSELENTSARNSRADLGFQKSAQLLQNPVLAYFTPPITMIYRWQAPGCSPAICCNARRECQDAEIPLMDHRMEMFPPELLCLMLALQPKQRKRHF